jgi:hypothetical protein
MTDVVSSTLIFKERRLKIAYVTEGPGNFISVSTPLFTGG